MLVFPRVLMMDLNQRFEQMFIRGGHCADECIEDLVRMLSQLIFQAISSGAVDI